MKLMLKIEVKLYFQLKYDWKNGRIDLNKNHHKNIWGSEKLSVKTFSYPINPEKCKIVSMRFQNCPGKGSI